MIKSMIELAEHLASIEVEMRTQNLLFISAPLAYMAGLLFGLRIDKLMELADYASGEAEDLIREVEEDNNTSRVQPIKKKKKKEWVM